MRVLFQNMERMDLKEYAKKITDGVTQRVKTAYPSGSNIPL